MPPLPGFVILRDGAKYQSQGIVLSLSNSPWSFGLPLDAEPMGRTAGDGRCWLRLEDGRVGECRWVGHDEGYLRFEGIGRLETAKAEVVGAVV